MKYLYVSEYFPYFIALINDKNKNNYYDDDVGFEDDFGDLNFDFDDFDDFDDIDCYSLPFDGSEYYIPLFLELYDNNTLIKIKKYMEVYFYLINEYSHFDILNSINLSDIFMIIDLDFDITFEEFIIFKKYSSKYKKDKFSDS